MRRSVAVAVAPLACLALGALASVPFVACTGGPSGSSSGSDAGGGAIDEPVDGAPTITIGCPEAASTCADGSTGPSGACFADAGALDPSLRACTTSADCTIADLPEDCCGRVHAAGVSTSSTSTAKACGDAKNASCGARGCFTQGTVADDGSSDLDGGSPTGATVSVTCTHGICTTKFTPPNDPSCPAAFGTVDATCTVGTTCNYPQGSCTCILYSGCAVPQPPHDEWACTARRTDGCPDDTPAQGAACPVGESCTYGSCCTQTFTCPAGQWVAGGLGCPG